MRRLVSGMAAAALLASTSLTYAADAQPASAAAPDGQLAPGGAAGVHNAQLLEGSTAWWWVGGTLFVAGVGAAVLLSQHSHTATTSSTH